MEQSCILVVVKRLVIGRVRKNTSGNYTLTTYDSRLLFVLCMRRRLHLLIDSLDRTRWAVVIVAAGIGRQLRYTAGRRCTTRKRRRGATQQAIIVKRDLWRQSVRMSSVLLHMTSRRELHQQSVHHIRRILNCKGWTVILAAQQMLRWYYANLMLL